MFWNPSHASKVTTQFENVPVMFEIVGGVSGSSKPRLPQTTPILLRSHFTSPLFAIDINLDLMKIALMIFYDEIVLSFSRIWQFIVFSLAFYGIIRQKAREETFAAKVRVDDFITGIWIIFFFVLQRGTFFFVYDGQSPKAISNTPLQLGYLGRKKFINQWHDDSFFGFPA